MFCDLRRGIEITDAECRSSAAAPIFCKRHLEAECFQNFHRRNSNVRFVITHEGVVPEDDAASSVAALCERRFLLIPAVIDRRYSFTLFREPFVEAFACIMWQ